MIGNKADATKALMREVKPFSTFGGDRLVYLINGVIYKVSRAGGDYYNHMEYDNMMRGESDGFINYPLTHLFNIGDRAVIAMEYISGDPVGECYCLDDNECGDDCLSEDTLDRIAAHGMTDRCYGNLIMRDGQLYIVDFGE